MGVSSDSRSRRTTRIRRLAKAPIGVQSLPFSAGTKLFQPRSRPGAAPPLAHSGHCLVAWARGSPAAQDRTYVIAHGLGSPPSRGRSFCKRAIGYPWRPCSRYLSRATAYRRSTRRAWPACRSWGWEYIGSMIVSSPGLKAFLLETPFFGGLPDASLDLLVSMLVERRFDV